jgi:hypothetical protein
MKPFTYTEAKDQFKDRTKNGEILIVDLGDKSRHIVTKFHAANYNVEFRQGVAEGTKTNGFHFFPNVQDAQNFLIHGVKEFADSNT